MEWVFLDTFYISYSKRHPKIFYEINEGYKYNDKKSSLPEYN